MKNKELLRVFAAYINATVVGKDHQGSKHKFKVDNLNAFDLRNNHPSGDCTKIFCGIKTCQLILAPLSKITHKHAIEVAKIINAHHPHSECLKFDAGLVIAGYKVNANRSSSLWNCDVIDYLRSQSYNCGYAHHTADELIAMGIVVYKNPPNEEA